MNRVLIAIVGFGIANAIAEPIPDLPEKATLALDEDWSSGRIDPHRWYALRKQWGNGNAGVVPENLAIVNDEVDGMRRKVLRCLAHGDRYEGPISGLWGKTARVGGVLVSKQHFASGRFEVVMKIGSPDHPRPAGMVPAIWTYGYRMVKVTTDAPDAFHSAHPLYHPYLQQWGPGQAFYWSEIDFPEYGKAGEYRQPMYNTFLNKQHDSTTFDVGDAADGQYHRYVTEWRTGLVPIADVTDDQVAASEGFYWIQDQAIPYENYWGAPLKRLEKDHYAAYAGLSAKHWIDGKYIGENTKLVPAMTGQLNLGVWLPDWAGPADWESVPVHFASIRVWQFDDAGDVKGILTEDITDSFDNEGKPIRD